MQVETESDLTLKQLLDRIGEKGFGLFLLCLSLPSALPIPAPGYSTPFGILILLLAWQLIVGKQDIHLPERFGKLRLSPKLRGRMVSALDAVLGRLERFIRPRQGWVGSQGGRRLLGSLITVMALLMILPIPLTNTAPAGVIFLIALGLTEEDGLVCLFGAIIGAFAVLLYGGVIYLFAKLLIEVGGDWSGAAEAFKELLRGWIETIKSWLDS